MPVLGIDPGPKGKGCGWVLIDQHLRLDSFGQDEPQNIPFVEADIVVIEMISSYGMAVGMSVFETLIEAGRCVDRALRCAYTARHQNVKVYLLPRKDIKLIICGTAQAKDPNIRRALLDKFAASGGGATPQIGTKARPGPLYGMKSHCWPALAAAMAWIIQTSNRERDIDLSDWQYTNGRWNEFRT